MVDQVGATEAFSDMTKLVEAFGNNMKYGWDKGKLEFW